MRYATEGAENMPATTINNINKALADANLPFEIVKGNCYFWFAALEAAPMGSEDKITSIYSNHIRAMSVAEYVAHVGDSF
jgi:hypothetical protein|tara:strand:- start:660 stop:899 length:240 start_codon:yes stop_codon:yes gene_type:complete